MDEINHKAQIKLETTEDNKEEYNITIQIYLDKDKEKTNKPKSTNQLKISTLRFLLKDHIDRSTFNESPIGSLIDLLPPSKYRHQACEWLDGFSLADLKRDYNLTDKFFDECTLLQLTNRIIEINNNPMQSSNYSRASSLLYSPTEIKNFATRINEPSPKMSNVLRASNKFAHQEDNELLCSLCSNNYSDVVFLPCSHLAHCLRCSNRLNSCNICQKTVMEKLLVKKHNQHEHSELEEKQMCINCLGARADCFFIDCKHLLYCMKCAKSVNCKAAPCISCNSPIERLTTISRNKDN